MLLLIKHSISNANANQPPSEWGLTAEGVQRVQTLTDHIRPYQPTTLASSIMPKAMHTADILASVLQLPYTTHPQFNEHARDTNAPFFDRVADFRAAVRQVLTELDTLSYGSETGSAALARFSSGVSAVHRAGAVTAIVAHGTVISLFVAAHNPHVDVVALWVSLGLPSFVVLADDYKLMRVVEDAGSRLP